MIHYAHSCAPLVHYIIGPIHIELHKVQNCELGIKIKNQAPPSMSFSQAIPSPKMSKLTTIRADIVNRLFSISHQLETQPLSINLISNLLQTLAHELDNLKTQIPIYHSTPARFSKTHIPPNTASTTPCFETRCTRISDELYAQSQILPGRYDLAHRGAVVIKVLAVQVGRLVLVEDGGWDWYAERMDTVAEGMVEEWRGRDLTENEETERLIREGHELWVRLNAEVEGCGCFQCGKRRARNVFYFE